MPEEEHGPEGKGGLSRRDLLKRGSVAAGVLASGAWSGNATAAAKRGTAARNSARSGVVNFLSWPGHGDPFLLKPFERETGIKVRVKEYANGDQMITLATTSPPGTFDVLMVDPELIEQLNKADVLAAMDPGDYPQTKDLWPQFRPEAHFPVHWYGGKMYSVAWGFTYLSLTYNTQHLSKKDVSSYEVLWDPKLKGKIGWLDWWSNGMGVISMYDGNRKTPYDISNERFEHLKKTLFSLKPQVAGFYSIGDVIQAMATAQAWAQPGGGDWAASGLARDGKPVAAAVPKEGGVQVTESLSLFKSAKNLENAKKFIRYCLSPRGMYGKALLPAYQEAPCSKAAWALIAKQNPKFVKALNINLKGPNVLDAYNEGRIALRRLPKQQTIEKWNEAWTEFKNL